MGSAVAVLYRVLNGGVKLGSEKLTPTHRNIEFWLPDSQGFWLPEIDSRDSLPEN